MSRPSRSQVLTSYVSSLLLAKGRQAETNASSAALPRSSASTFSVLR